MIASVMHAALTLSRSPTLRSAITIGVIGGLTTYSSFNYETTRLLEEGSPGLAALNMTATLAGALLAGWLGICAPGNCLAGKGGGGRDASIGWGPMPGPNLPRRIESVSSRAITSRLAGASATRGLCRHDCNPQNGEIRREQRDTHRKPCRTLGDLPVLLEVVDDQAHVDKLLPILDEIAGCALVTVERVRVVRYAAGAKRDNPPSSRG